MTQLDRACLVFEGLCWSVPIQRSQLYTNIFCIRTGLQVNGQAHLRCDMCTSVMYRYTSRGSSPKIESKVHSWSKDYLAEVIQNVTFHLSGKCGL